MPQTDREKAIQANLRKNDQVPKSYYENHFTKDELGRIAQGSPNGEEVFRHVFRTSTVTPHQQEIARQIIKERKMKNASN